MAAANTGNEVPGDGHQPVLFNGTLPAATANIGRELSTTEIATQRIQAEAFYNYLVEPTSDHLLTLNEGVLSLTAVTNVPRSSKLRF